MQKQTYDKIIDLQQARADRALAIRQRKYTNIALKIADHPTAFLFAAISVSIFFLTLSISLYRIYIS